MITKLQIAKFLIFLGFILHISNYGYVLIDFYIHDDKVSMAIEESESSEQKEKEGKEKEDVKEKDIISEKLENALADWIKSNLMLYPDFYSVNTSVFLEHNTPPPEFS